MTSFLSKCHTCFRLVTHQRGGLPECEVCTRIAHLRLKRAIIIGVATAPLTIIVILILESFILKG